LPKGPYGLAKDRVPNLKKRDNFSVPQKGPEKRILYFKFQTKIKHLLSTLGQNFGAFTDYILF
jgi:hypothetical protein